MWMTGVEDEAPADGGSDDAPPSSSWSSTSSSAADPAVGTGFARLKGELGTGRVKRQWRMWNTVPGVAFQAGRRLYWRRP